MINKYPYPYIPVNRRAVFFTEPLNNRLHTGIFIPEN